MCFVYICFVRSEVFSESDCIEYSLFKFGIIIIIICIVHINKLWNRQEEKTMGICSYNGNCEKDYEWLEETSLCPFIVTCCVLYCDSVKSATPFRINETTKILKLIRNNSRCYFNRKF